MSEASKLRYGAAVFFFIWYIVISTVANTGFIEILLKFRHRTLLSSTTKTKRSRRYKKETGEELSENDAKLTYEGVTIIRPIKGIDPELSSCLESSLVQNYPSDKIQLLFCIDDPQDASIPIIRKLINKYPTIDAEILISENFNPKTNSSSEHYGPNPKVNNLAKGFLKAKYDILWVMDSNVWASSNILRNSVFTMNMNLNNGRKLGNKRPVKLVHHVPLAMCIDSNGGMDDCVIDLEGSVTPTNSEDDSDYASVTSQSSNLTNRKASPSPQLSLDQQLHHVHHYNESRKLLGAKLDDMFLHSSHSKFYVALNNLSIAPCVNGKSNMYRKSDLDQAVKLIPYKNSPFFSDPKVKSDAQYYTSLGLGHAIKFFARYIGEDNMIGIALWENCNGRTGLTGDVVVQPLSRHDNTVQDYMQRRIRWLRVRKYMVSLATFIEPTTESIVCGIYGTFAISTLFFNQWFSIKWFLLHMTVWCLSDFIQYNILINHVKSTTSANVTYLPRWMDNIHVVHSWGEVVEWLQVWVLREVLALPIWFSAMFGHEIDWRGRPFKIKKDLTAEEL
ncbi:Hsx11 UDP-glucose:ceramide glucosyltransferase [Candida orthopsilosis Co 90-125]|uniref:Ceramide glucosyltransferase n=1 Tax=Candida orthopsilosis (strain 90-125) TaxID=1136231 RepID=H8X6W3_CANO9|nr:Hsx11 UDP-glucose:ceramide glucosyltransferase [Candida orthopsilosis Co 90-125]CCG23724.1 Hsx11 UDP-glucose:ceramide glucosyltransferase [Candida orthopsilosis Co 90-125]